MTDTKIRRGVRPLLALLLALLLAGMALLMMGATPPAIAATAAITTFAVVPGGYTAADEVDYAGTVTYSGVTGSVGAKYHVDLVVDYYYGSTIVATETHVVVPVANVGGGNPIGVGGMPTCSGYSIAKAGYDALTVPKSGFKWHYHMVLEAVNDDDPPAVYDHKEADTDEQSWGAFSQGGGGDSPIG